MTVSVVIPTYNHRAYVLDALDSVFRQTFTDYEVIVVNDGSPDDTGEVLRPLAEAGRIRYIEQPNAGQAAARNRGIAEARGEFIALLDDDDLWPPDKLAWQTAALVANPTWTMVTGYSEVLGAGPASKHPESLPAPHPGKRLFAACNWIRSPGQVLIRREAVRRIGLFDPAIRGADDWDLYIRLAEAGPVVFVDRLALYYRLHASNASADCWGMFTNVRRVYRKHFARPASASDVEGQSEYRHVTLAHYHSQLLAQGDGHRVAGRPWEAAKAYARAVYVRPSRAALFVSLRRTLPLVVPKWLLRAVAPVLPNRWKSAARTHRTPGQP